MIKGQQSEKIRNGGYHRKTLLQNFQLAPKNTADILRRIAPCIHKSQLPPACKDSFDNDLWFMIPREEFAIPKKNRALATQGESADASLFSDILPAEQEGRNWIAVSYRNLDTQQIQKLTADELGIPSESGVYSEFRLLVTQEMREKRDICGLNIESVMRKQTGQSTWFIKPAATRVASVMKITGCMTILEFKRNKQLDEYNALLISLGIKSDPDPALQTVTTFSYHPCVITRLTEHLNSLMLRIKKSWKEHDVFTQGANNTIIFTNDYKYDFDAQYESLMSNDRGKALSLLAGPTNQHENSLAESVDDLDGHSDTLQLSIEISPELPSMKKRGKTTKEKKIEAAKQVVQKRKLDKDVATLEDAKSKIGFLLLAHTASFSQEEVAGFIYQLQNEGKLAAAPTTNLDPSPAIEQALSSVPCHQYHLPFGKCPPAKEPVYPAILSNNACLGERGLEGIGFGEQAKIHNQGMFKFFLPIHTKC